MTCELIASIDDSTHFSFIDSGAPPGVEDYTTIVCIHGNTFHKPIFQKLLPIAQEYKLRILAFNRRSYPGSSPFTPDELDALKSKDAVTLSSFFKCRGLELAKLVVWIVRELRIPLPRAGPAGGGGLVFIGWSMGNIITMAFSRFLSEFPEDVKTIVVAYLRGLIVYETTMHLMGYPHPSDIPYPTPDPAVPQQTRTDLFANWVSSYYAHPYFRSESTSDRNFKNFIHLTPKEEERFGPSTYETMNSIEKEECLHVPGGETDFLHVLSGPNINVLFDLTKGTFLADHDTNDKKLKTHFLPNLKVSYIYCETSLWSCIAGAWSIEDDIATWRKEGRQVRPITTYCVERANHFYHWDEPAGFLATISKFVES